MLIIPAIDIKGGQCVRLVHGDPSKKTVYSADPVETAQKWESQGARRLHVVDLDAAMNEGSNLELIGKIKAAVSCEVQMGGGVRSLDILKKVFDLKIDRAILGTALLKDPLWIADAVAEYPGRLMAGVDARDGEVKVEGWKEGSGRPFIDVIQEIEVLGFSEVIYTDISRDGTLSGPGLENTKTVLNYTKMGVFASGGVSSLDDVRALKILEKSGLKGCVVGKALYDGRLSYAEAAALC